MPQASARGSVDHLLRYMPRDKSVVLAPLSLQETKKSGERRPMALAPAEMIQCGGCETLPRSTKTMIYTAAVKHKECLSSSGLAGTASGVGSTSLTDAIIAEFAVL